MRLPASGAGRPGSSSSPHTGNEPGPGDLLTPHEQAVLDFERTWHRRPGARTQAIRDQFGIPEVHYYRELNALLDRRAALAYAPVVVNRLRAARDRAARTPGRRP